MKIKNNIVLILLIIPFVFSSCGKKEEPRKEKPHELGKYLYLCDDNVLHTTRHCIGLYDATDEDGHKVTGIHFIPTERFIADPKTSYCKWCFDDEFFEEVRSISDDNQTIFDWEQYEVK